jgi:hypothetical protein
MMDKLGFLKVSQVLSSSCAAALRAEVLAELSKQPWWWGSWGGKLSRMASGVSTSSSSSSASASSAYIQEADSVTYSPDGSFYATTPDAAGPPDASSSSAASSNMHQPSEESDSGMYQEANIRSSFRRRVLKMPLSFDGSGSPLALLSHEAVRAVVRAHAEVKRPDGSPLLSHRARLVELTAVVSMPGAFAQDPHADILQEDDDEGDEDDEEEEVGKVGEGGEGAEHGGGRIRKISGGQRPPKPSKTLPTLLTSWVSLQPVGTNMVGRCTLNQVDP